MMLNLKHELMKKKSMNYKANMKKKNDKKYTLDMTTQCISIGFMMREV